MVMISNIIDHSKGTVILDTDRTLRGFASGGEGIYLNVIIWSDGPSFQFKNRHIVSAVPWLIGAA